MGKAVTPSSASWVLENPKSLSRFLIIRRIVEKSSTIRILMFLSNATSVVTGGNFVGAGSSPSIGYTCVEFSRTGPKHRLSSIKKWPKTGRQATRNRPLGQLLLCQSVSRLRKRRAARSEEHTSE